MHLLPCLSVLAMAANTVAAVREFTKTLIIAWPHPNATFLGNDWYLVPPEPGAGGPVRLVSQKANDRITQLSMEMGRPAARPGEEDGILIPGQSSVRIVELAHSWNPTWSRKKPTPNLDTGTFTAEFVLAYHDSKTGKPHEPPVMLQKPSMKDDGHPASFESVPLPKMKTLSEEALRDNRLLVFQTEDWLGLYSAHVPKGVSASIFDLASAQRPHYFWRRPANLGPLEPSFYSCACDPEKREMFLVYAAHDILKGHMKGINGKCFIINDLSFYPIHGQNSRRLDALRANDPPAQQPANERPLQRPDAQDTSGFKRLKTPLDDNGGSKYAAPQKKMALTEPRDSQPWDAARGDGPRRDIPDIRASHESGKIQPAAPVDQSFLNSFPKLNLNTASARSSVWDTPSVFEAETPKEAPEILDEVIDPKSEVKEEEVKIEPMKEMKLEYIKNEEQHPTNENSHNPPITLLTEFEKKRLNLRIESLSMQSYNLQLARGLLSVVDMSTFDTALGSMLFSILRTIGRGLEAEGEEIRHRLAQDHQ